MTRQLYWLDTFDNSFPNTEHALVEPNGLLAVGGDLTIPRLLCAYKKGIFPWFSEGQPVLWWTPNPRMVLFPENIHINRSLRKLARKHLFKISVDTAFQSVIEHCSQPRIIEGAIENSTWITDDILDAYNNLHKAGFAHSIEAWHEEKLVGGLYGVSLGKVFYGESMFSRMSGASKMAFATLAQQLLLWQYKLIDCQMHSNYLASFGAKEIPRKQFEALLNRHISQDPLENWQSGNHTHNSWRENWTMPEHGFD